MNRIEEDDKTQGEEHVIDPNQLQYFTMAAWMRGYAASLDEYQQKKLILKLTKAADMLDAVWGKYIKEEGE